MSDDKPMRLALFEERDGWIIAWDDDGCPGGRIGDRGLMRLPEHAAATRAAEQAAPPDSRERVRGWIWDSKSRAMKALRAARAAAKAQRCGPPQE